MTTPNQAAGAQQARAVGIFDRSEYVVAVVAMTIVVLLGFWPFYAALIRGGSGAHWIIYLHAAVYTGWLVLLLTQVLLVARRRTQTHQRLGQYGAYYGVVVLLMGLVVTFAAPALNVAAGRSTVDEAASFLILPLGDMLLFGAFFGAGIATRRRPAIHRQWMILASTALIFPGAARFGDPYGLAVIVAIWLLPLGLLMTHEQVTRRRVGRVYLIGAAILLVALARLGIMDSEAWRTIGRALLEPFLRIT